MTVPSFSSLSAGERAAALVDGGAFTPRADLSPKLTLRVGHGRIGGRDVVLALTDGRQHGGTLGVHEASLLDVVVADLIASADQAGGTAPALVLGFDTGGVRVEEGPAALAAVSTVGVALARLIARGVHVVALISGPRGCFGAPSVMAALPQTVVMVENAHWGLTGPRLIEKVRSSTTDRDEYATAASTRLANGDADAVVADEPRAVRDAVAAALAQPPAYADSSEVLRAARDTCAMLRERLRSAPGYRPPAVRRARPRDILRYSFRGQWRPSGPTRHTPLLQAALGTIGDRAAVSLVVGPEQDEGIGVGIEEAALVTEMIEAAASLGGPPAAILTFVFCQGHVVDFTQERFGLPRALAECLRALVVARRRGHPIITTLGGGTYGAAYLAFAAPSHRLLALRGTSVAPMAPDVLRAFQTLRGPKRGDAAAIRLAELIPAVRTVESVIRLPRALRDELESLLSSGRRV